MLNAYSLRDLFVFARKYVKENHVNKSFLSFSSRLYRDKPLQLIIFAQKSLNMEDKKETFIRLLRSTGREGIEKVIATSTFRETADRFLKSVALDGRFDHIVYGDDLSESKPKPQIYLKAIEPFPYDKEEILAFEDSANGILSAHAAGLKVVHIPDIAYIPEEIKEKSFIVLKDLLEAIKLIDSLNE